MISFYKKMEDAEEHIRQATGDLRTAIDLTMSPSDLDDMLDSVTKHLRMALQTIEAYRPPRL